MRPEPVGEARARVAIRDIPKCRGIGVIWFRDVPNCQGIGIAWITKGLRAMASQPRLSILQLLKNPGDTFSAQPVGTLAADGVTGGALMKKLGCTAPTLSEHMDTLIEVGFIQSKKVGRWMLYRRDEGRIEQFLRELYDVI